MKIIYIALTALLIFSAATADAKVVSRTVSYKHEGAELEGYMAYDDSISGKRPGVLVVHEWWGLNDYVRRRANMLAELGYVAFAADMYGKGKVTEDVKQASEWAGQFKGNVGLLRGRVQAGLDVLKKEKLVDPAHLAAIGYCFGGTTVQHLAFTGAELKVIVSFHGELVNPSEEESGLDKAKILIAQGSADGLVKPENVKDYIDAMNKTKIDWRMIIYSGAKHSFTNQDSDRAGLPGVGYDKNADARSWADMKAFFKEVL